MDELKVGEYGRTNFGKIIKFAWYEKEKEILNDKAVILVDKMRTTTDCFYYFEKGECIVKHSKNIIDLIEVGDYVNGEKIEQITTDSGYKKYYTTGFGVYDEYDNESVIHSILTKEQYEANCYKVGGEDEQI